MKTGCLFSAPAAGRVSIARSVPRFLRGRIPTYPLLAPPAWMHGRFPGDPDKWGRLYRHVVLDRLDPETVWRELHALTGDAEPVLCCWETLTTPGDFCHRTTVASWLQEALGEPISEYPVSVNTSRQLDLFAA